MITRVRARLSPPLNRDAVLSLVAAVLKTTVEDLEGAMDWNANYMAWHEGGEVEEFYVWPKDEGEILPAGHRRSDG